MISGDTIAAIATAPGRSGVAVVRVSGPEAFAVAERLTGRCLWGSGVSPLVGIRKIRFYTSGGTPLPPYTSGGTPLPQAEDPLIDEAVVLAFKGPRSYTGEDVVEFQCHGGAVTPRRVLGACLAAGARLARRGEFTQRAFLNGKLDYDQSKSVLDLIDAKTARAADAALEGLSGRRRRELKSLYDAALDLSTQVEHALDVDEGELPVGFVDELRAKSEELRIEIRRAIRRANEGKVLREGALVVLAGPPNAGKSSLMNALLEENRAIVSDVPGTTRDSIEEWMDLGGWPVRLVDTAGLRRTGDAVEAEGVRRAEDLMAKADVVVWLRGCGVEELRGPQLLTIHSKCDLGRGPGLNVSAKTGEGLEELKRSIVERLEAKVGEGDEGGATAADETALHEALAALESVPAGACEARGVTGEEDLVLLANAVRAVAERLGASVGAVYSSDLMDNLFSRFCVGK